MSTLATSIDIVLKVIPVQNARKRKIGIKMEKENTTLYSQMAFFIYIDSLKESTKKLLNLICKFRKISVLKVDI